MIDNIRKEAYNVNNKLTDKATVTSDQDFTYFDSLNVVKPEAVTIIR